MHGETIKFGSMI